MEDDLLPNNVSLDDYKFSEDFTEYCDNLDDAGDVIFNVALSILKGASGWFKSADGLIFLEWPKFADGLGDDALDIVSLLKSKRLISTSGGKLHFNSDSTCLYQKDGEKVLTLPISKLASRVLSDEISLFPGLKSQNKIVKPRPSSGGKVTTPSVIGGNNSDLFESISDAKGSPEYFLALFDEYVAKNMKALRKDIEYVEKKNCLGFSAISSIFQSMIADGLMDQSGRGMIYSLIFKGHIILGWSHFETKVLEKSWKEFNIESES